VVHCTKKGHDTKFYRSLNDEITEYIGIAYDERRRIKDKPNAVYPLVEWGVTEKQALEYCYSKGFDWEGLYNLVSRTGCYCCPLKNLQDLKNIYIHFPELWENIQEMQRKSRNQFRQDYSVFDLGKKFSSYCKGSDYLEGELGEGNQLRLEMGGRIFE